MPKVHSDDWSLVLPSIAGASGASARGAAKNGGGSAVIPLPRVAQPASQVSSPRRQSHERIREAAGRTLTRLLVRDVQQNNDLRKEMRGLQLNQYFDDRGSPRFRRLGLSFAAKHNSKIQTSFGSREVETADQDSDAEERAQETTTAQYLAAAAAKDYDVEYRKKQRAAMLSSIGEKDKLRVEEVRRRQVEVLFSEAPDFASFLPSAVDEGDLLPDDLGKDAEQRNRHLAERENDKFFSKDWEAGVKCDWMFSREEVILLSQVAHLWTRAAHGSDCPMGMDRSTFCRFILDLGLVDQDKVPFYWAVSLFDKAAYPMRCVEEVGSGGRGFRALVVSRWGLISILDEIFCRNFNQAQKGAFFAMLQQIAAFRLPRYVIDECEIRQVGGPKRAPGDEEDGDTVSLLLASGRRQPVKQGRRDSTRSVTKEPEKVVVADLNRRELVRDECVRNMLLEPEVLHLLAQHAEVFKALHAFYADEHGDMSFPMLMQFATDFHLTPGIASVHFLQRVYGSSRNLEVAPWKKPGLASLPLPGRYQERSSARSSSPSSVSEVSSFASRSPKKRETSSSVSLAKAKRRGGGEDSPRSPRRARAAAGSPTARSDSRSRKSERASGSSPAKSGRRAGRMATQGTSSATSASGYSPPSTPTSICVREEPEEQYPSWPPAQPWQGVIELVKKAPKHGDAGKAAAAAAKPQPTKFGAAAFTEALCRVAFTYLGYYGNLEQQNMNSFLRAVWLITYLRSVFAHLRQSLAKRTGQPSGEEEAPEMPCGALLRVLQEMPTELWASPAFPEVPRLRPRGERPVSAQSSSGKRPSFKIAKTRSEQSTFSEASEDVLDGTCKSCNRLAGPRQWGSPHCPDCSVVDALGFYHHPLHGLLCDVHPPGTNLEPPVCERPRRVERNVLTPPPLGVSNMFR